MGLDPSRQIHQTVTTKQLWSSIKGAPPWPPVQRMGSISLSMGGTPGGRRVDPTSPFQKIRII